MLDAPDPLLGQFARYIMASVTEICFHIAVTSVALFLLSALIAGRGYAHEPDLYFGNVIVEEATATAAPAGGYSKLRFKLINNGSQSVHFLGIETDIAEDAKVFAHLGAEDWAMLESIGVPSGEILDLHSSHFYVLLGPLRWPLEEGEVFDARLKLVFTEIPTIFHVHPAK
jgi:copper(I)-binding protein